MDDKIIPGFNDSESVAEMRRRQAATGREMQRVGLLALQALEKKIAAGEIVLSVDDAKALVDAGTEMRRLALGKPDDEPNPTESKPN